MTISLALLCDPIDHSTISSPHAGVKRADVNLLAETADVVFDADKVNARDIMAAVDDVGFDAALAEDDRGFAMEKARARREEEATGW